MGRQLTITPQDNEFRCDVCFKPIGRHNHEVHSAMHDEDCPLGPLDERIKCLECFEKAEARCNCGVADMDMWAIAEEVVIKEVFMKEEKDARGASV